jgi:hypothetical protein
VVEREASVDVLFRRTDWFKVRDERGVEGWARAQDMRRTRLADGSPFVFILGDSLRIHLARLGDRARRRPLRRRQPDQHLRRVFAHRQHEDRGDACRSFSATRPTATRPKAGLNHVIFPEWRISPILELGTGFVITEPRADHRAAVGPGPIRPHMRARAIRAYLTRRFFVRADYRWHTIFTSRDDNQELEEWKVVIACFF